MDKSSHYIKMCESAKVIQKQWKPEFGDFFVSMSLGLTSPCQPIASDLEKKVSYLKTMGLRVLVWVNLYLLEHRGKDFQSKIFLIS